MPKSSPAVTAANRSRYRGGGTLSKQALNELYASLPVTETLEQALNQHGISPLIQRTLLALQRTVAVQGKLLHDQSRAITRMQHQLYALNCKLNHKE